MKFPKLRHAGLCNILIFLPALFLFFAIGFNILFYMCFFQTLTHFTNML